MYFYSSAEEERHSIKLLNKPKIPMASSMLLNQKFTVVVLVCLFAVEPGKLIVLFENPKIFHSGKNIQSTFSISFLH